MLELDVPEGCSALDAFNQLCSRFPALKHASSSIAFAVNQAQTAGDRVLEPGDELALLPPMAGG